MQTMPVQKANRLSYGPLDALYSEGVWGVLTPEYKVIGRSIVGGKINIYIYA